MHASVYGQRDVEAGLPVESDTLWRIYSMTKPITSVAAMSLWEEGHFELTDEISRWIPAFADVRVYEKGSSTKPYTVPAAEPVRVWHLLSHTSGLTYGFLNTSVVDAIYRVVGLRVGRARRGPISPPRATPGPRLPLLFQPGSAWGYSVATDVLGRLVEIWSGQPLDAAIASRVTGPLGMTDTRWWVDAGIARDERTSGALYTPNPVDRERRPGWTRSAAAALAPPRMLSGGGGLISTAADYERFTRMLLRGGELDGARVLSPRTLRFMTENHLPGGADLGALSTGGFAETTFDGIGFGLGFAVVARSTAGEDAVQPRRVLLGRCGQHGLLGRSRRGDHGPLLHPAAALEQPPAAPSATSAGEQRAGLTGTRSMCR